MIYTKQGDKGVSSLFGGQKVPKDHPRLEAYGTLDELNSSLGALNAYLLEKSDNDFQSFFYEIQNALFNLGSYLACSDEKMKQKLPAFSEKFIHHLEKKIDHMEAHIPPLKVFILPTGCFESALAHQCRTICRRAERRVVQVSKKEPLEEVFISYLNRLSDYFFVLARYLNYKNKITEQTWDKDIFIE